MDKKQKKIWKEIGDLTDNLTTIVKSIKKQDEIIDVLLDVVKKQTKVIRINTESIGALERIISGKVSKREKRGYIS